MANEGYITLSRNMLRHWIATDKRWLGWWVMLLFKASWEDNQTEVYGNMVNIKRGQMMASGRSLAIEFEADRSTIENFLRTLEREGMIKRELKLGRKLSVITIVNYDKYQMKPDFYEQDSTIKPTTKPTTQNEVQEVDIEEVESDGTIEVQPQNQPQNQPQLNKINKINNNNTTNVVLPTSEDNENEIKILKIEDMLLAKWNDLCGELPKVKTLSARRKLKLGARAKEWGKTDTEVLTHASELFSRIACSSFLTGKKGGWRATFDWVITNDTNWRKVEEGNYDDRISGAEQSRGCTTSEIRDLISAYKNASGQ